MDLVDALTREAMTMTTSALSAARLERIGGGGGGGGGGPLALPGEIEKEIVEAQIAVQLE